MKNLLLSLASMLAFASCAATKPSDCCKKDAACCSKDGACCDKKDPKCKGHAADACCSKHTAAKPGPKKTN